MAKVRWGSRPDSQCPNCCRKTHLPVVRTSLGLQGLRPLQTGTQRSSGGTFESRHHDGRDNRRRRNLAGHPFVGPVAGYWIAPRGAGIERSRVYVTNVVKHFKWERRTSAGSTRNRTRRKSAPAPWLDTEIALVKPRVLVCLGVRRQGVARTSIQVTQQRGTFVPSTIARPLVTATVHPSAILLAPDDHPGTWKCAVVADLKKVTRAMLYRIETQMSIFKRHWLSMPQMQDPNFARAVVLCAILPEGAFGIVLKRPTDVRRARWSNSIRPSQRATSCPVHWGRCSLTRMDSDRGAAGRTEFRTIVDGLYLSTSRRFCGGCCVTSAPRARVLADTPAGSSQLDDELAQSAWLMVMVKWIWSSTWRVPHVGNGIRRLGADPLMLQTSPGVH